MTISTAVTSSSGVISEAAMLLFSEDPYKIQSSMGRSFTSLYFYVMGNHVCSRTDTILSLHSMYEIVASCSLVVPPCTAPKEMIINQLYKNILRTIRNMTVVNNKSIISERSWWKERTIIHYHQTMKKKQPLGPVYMKCQCQQRVNAVMTLGIQLAVKSMESLWNSSQPYSQVTPFVSFVFNQTNISSVICSVDSALMLTLGVNGTLHQVHISFFRIYTH